MSYKRVLFVGSKTMGLQALEAINGEYPGALTGIVTWDDSDDPRSRLGAFLDDAEAWGIPIYLAKDKKDGNRLIAQAKKDVVIVAGWYWMIDRETLLTAPGQFYCLHNSILPTYRGAAPLVWAIMNDEKVVGFSIFRMTTGMDDGQVLHQAATDVQDVDDIDSILKRLEQEVPETIIQALRMINAGEHRLSEQDHSQATWGTFRTEADGEIDWKKPARRIFNEIRAQAAPYPGAFTHLPDGRKMRIWKASYTDKTYYGEPGQVASVDVTGVEVVCGDNKPVRIEAVTLDDNGIVRVTHTANAIINSIKMRLGSKPLTLNTELRMLDTVDSQELLKLMNLKV